MLAVLTVFALYATVNSHDVLGKVSDGVATVQAFGKTTPGQVLKDAPGRAWDAKDVARATVFGSKCEKCKGVMNYLAGLGAEPACAAACKLSYAAIAPFCPAICSALYTGLCENLHMSATCADQVCYTVFPSVCKPSGCDMEGSQVDKYDCECWFPDQGDCDFRSAGRCAWNPTTQKCINKDLNTDLGALGKACWVDHRVPVPGFTKVSQERQCSWQKHKDDKKDSCDIHNDWKELAQITPEWEKGNCNFNAVTDKIECDRHVYCEVGVPWNVNIQLKSLRMDYDCSGCDPRGTLKKKCCHECHQMSANKVVMPNGEKVLTHLQISNESLRCVGCENWEKDDNDEFPDHYTVDCKMDEYHNKISCSANAACGVGDSKTSQYPDGMCCHIYQCKPTLAFPIPGGGSCTENPQLTASCCDTCLTSFCNLPDGSKEQMFCDGCMKNSLDRVKQLLKMNQPPVWLAKDGMRTPSPTEKWDSQYYLRLIAACIGGVVALVGLGYAMYRCSQVADRVQKYLSGDLELTPTCLLRCMFCVDEPDDPEDCEEEDAVEDPSDAAESSHELTPLT